MFPTTRVFLKLYAISVCRTPRRDVLFYSSEGESPLCFHHLRQIPFSLWSSYYSNADDHQTTSSAKRLRLGVVQTTSSTSINPLFIFSHYKWYPLSPNSLHSASSSKAVSDKIKNLRPHYSLYDEDSAFIVNILFILRQQYTPPSLLL